MTAAIPPACCAGADHGKPHVQLHSLGRVDRGDIDRTDPGPGHSSLGSESVAITFADADVHTDTDTDSLRITELNTNAKRNAIVDSD